MWEGRKPFKDSFKEWGEAEPKPLMCPEAALSWNYVLGHTGVEVQINQKAGPDAKGEKDAQAWYGSFLLYGEKVRSLKRGQLGSWQGTLPFTEASGQPPGWAKQVLLSRSATPSKAGGCGGGGACTGWGWWECALEHRLWDDWTPDWDKGLAGIYLPPIVVVLWGTQQTFLLWRTETAQERSFFPGPRWPGCWAPHRVLL